MRQANVMVTFGTSHPDAWARTLTPLTRETACRWPGTPVYTAVTSSAIRRALQDRGEEAFSLPQVLERLAGEGMERVRLCATHLVRGGDFARLEAHARELSGRFRQLLLSRPLLDTQEDRRSLARALDLCFPRQEGWLTLFAAHGIRGGTDEVCLSLEDMCAECGRSDLRFAALHGAPTLEQVLPRLRPEGQAVLAPLMLTAGEHTQTDLFGASPESWRSRLAQAGIQVRSCPKGLGEFPPIRQLYLEHFQQAQEL